MKIIHTLRAYRWSSWRRPLLKGVLALSLGVSIPIMGCTPEDAELLSKDLKHFIFNNGFARSDEAAERAVPAEAESSSVHDLEEAPQEE